MLAQRSKWVDVSEAFEEARRQAQGLRQREDRETDYWLLLFFLVVSAAGSAILMLHR